MKPKKMMMKLIRIGLGITVFSIIFLLNSCGHKKKPTGGEKDTISPKILSFYPPEFSKLNNSLEILFSKPIEKSTVFEGISIYPPILKKKLIWSDNLLHIKILESLKDSTNYFFKFSSSIKGIHQNPLDKNYTVIYYNGVLQNYSIYGTISYEKEEDKNKKITLSLFDSDSSLVFIKKISGVNYKLDYLNPDEYHIQAFIDRNGNKKYDFLGINTDRFLIEITFVFGKPRKKSFSKSEIHSDYLGKIVRIKRTLSNQLNVDVWGGPSLASNGDRVDCSRNFGVWKLPDYKTEAPKVYNDPKIIIKPKKFPIENSY